jgi:hypothetical protein
MATTATTTVRVVRTGATVDPERFVRPTELCKQQTCDLAYNAFVALQRA